MPGVQVLPLGSPGEQRHRGECGGTAWWCHIFSVGFSLCLPGSQEGQCHDQGRFSDVPAVGWGEHLQPLPPESLPGHDPASQPLLGVILTQHLSHGRPDHRAKQHRGLYQVKSMCVCDCVCVWEVNLFLSEDISGSADGCKRSRSNHLPPDQVKWAGPCFKVELFLNQAGCALLSTALWPGSHLVSTWV